MIKSCKKMISLRQYPSKSPETNKNVKQPGTLIVMSERVRFIRASDAADVIMLCSVKSPCSIKSITKDAKENNKQTRTGSTWDFFHVSQDVSNTMTTDRARLKDFTLRVMNKCVVLDVRMNPTPSPTTTNALFCMLFLFLSGDWLLCFHGEVIFSMT